MSRPIKRRGRRKLKDAGEQNSSGFWEPFDESPVLEAISGRHCVAIVFLVLASLTFLIYLNTFSSSFHVDDTHAIVENEQIRSLSQFWPPSGSRYVGYLSFALNYAVGGLEVFGYHLFNTTVHAINGLIVWWLVVLLYSTPLLRRAGPDDKVKYLIALCASIIFVSHPIQTQAVTYIAQRFASLATLFYLLSLTLYIKARSCDAKGIWPTTLFGAASVISAIFAMNTKEIAFTLPFVALLCEVVFFGGSPFNRLRLLLLFALSLTAITIPVLLLGSGGIEGNLIEGLGSATAETERTPRFVYLFTELRVLVTYLRLLFLPLGQNLDYDYPRYYSLFEVPVIMSLFLLAIVVVAALIVLVRSKKALNAEGVLIGFGVLCFFITLSVESSIIPIRDVIYEHRLYLPSVGAVIAFSAAVFYGYGELGRRWKRRPGPLLFTLIVLLITAAPLAASTVKRNFVWTDDFTLWSDVVEKSPGKARGYNALGVAYFNEELFDESKRHFRKAVTIKPDYAEAHFNLGLLYQELGEPARAVEELTHALSLKPNHSKARITLGRAYASLGRTKKALSTFLDAVKEAPGSSEVRFRLANAYKKAGYFDEAVSSYKKALEIDPTYAEARNNLGDLYFRQGLYDKAESEFSEAVRLDPSLAEAYNNLGLSYYRRGEYERAVAAFSDALNLRSDYPEAHNNIGSAYFGLGRIEKAKEHYASSIRLEPSNASAYYNIGLVYYRKGQVKKARQNFEEAARFSPGYGEPRDMLKRLDSR